MKNIAHYLMLSLGAFIVIGCTMQAVLIDNESRIIFFGDSITELGVKSGGYVTLIRESLQKNPKTANAEIIGAGISGNKITDLQQRLDRDVLQKKPTIVVIYIGINDVWHYVLPGLYGTPKDKFESGLRDIVTKIRQQGTTVILCTPSVVGEKNDGTNELDKNLDAYSEVTRSVARDMNLKLCDLRKAFQQYLKANNPDNLDQGILTYDRVHLNDDGNKFVAGELIKTMVQN